MVRNSERQRHRLLEGSGPPGNVSDSNTQKSPLAYGGARNWPIRIQQAGKTSLSCRQCKLTQERRWNQVTFLTRDGSTFLRKGIYNSKTHTRLQKVKNMKHCFVSKLLIWRQKWVTGVRHGNSLVGRRVWLFSCRFGRTAQLRLPLALQAQPPYARPFLSFWEKIE